MSRDISALVGASGLSETFAPCLIAIPPLGRETPAIGFGSVVGLIAIAFGRPPKLGDVGRIPPGLAIGALIAGPGRTFGLPTLGRTGGRIGGIGRGGGVLTTGGGL